jgi:ribose/xylose/arabinose/galactoside ABC-type transport system permease subunit
MDVPRLLITLGVLLVLAGVLWPLVQKMGLGRLPGDIVVEREHVRFYFPIVTSILVSVVLTVLFWLLRR